MLIQLLLEIVPDGPIHNKSALIKVMAWHRKSDKPLHKSVMT